MTAGRPTKRHLVNRENNNTTNNNIRIIASALTSERKKAAMRLQRQCIAALSGLALNSTGATVRPASREAVERGLLFLAAFHWSRSVRGEAGLALRRLQSQRSVPHPTAWGVKDCLKWLSCVDLDGMCKYTEAFLDDGKADLSATLFLEVDPLLGLSCSAFMYPAYVCMYVEVCTFFGASTRWFSSFLELMCTYNLCGVKLESIHEGLTPEMLNHPTAHDRARCPPLQ